MEHGTGTVSTGGANVFGVRTGVAMYRPEVGTLCGVDAGFAAISGHTEAALLGGMSYLDVVHPTDRDEVRARLAALAPGDTLAMTHRLPGAGGRQAHVLLYARLHRDGVLRSVVADVSGTRSARRITQAMLERMPCGVAACGVRWEDGHARLALLSANELFFDMFALARDAFDLDAAMDAGLYLRPEEWKRLRQAGQEAIATPGEAVQAECSVQADGGVRSILCSLTAAMHAGDEEARLILTAQDMTSLRRAEEALRQQTERFYLIAAATREYLIDYDARADVLVLTHTDGGLYKELPLRNYLRDLERHGTMSEEDRKALRGLFADIIEGRLQKGAIDLRTDMITGEMTWRRIQAAAVTDGEGAVARVVGRVMDIDERKERELQLRAHAERDALTSLYNRGTAQMLIDDFLAHENAMHSEERHALLMLDIDDFKLVNDRLGHAHGDAVLAEVAASIQEAFRNDDIVARIGGDEFVVLAKRIESPEVLERMARRLCDAAARTLRTEEARVDISISAGIAIYPVHGDSYAALFHAADIASYRAKAQGKNRHCLYAGEDMEAYRGPRDEETPVAGAPVATLEARLLALLNRPDAGEEVYDRALEAIGTRFGMRRGYILPYDRTGGPLPCRHRWAAAGDVSAEEIEALAPGIALAMDGAMGGLILRTPREMPPEARKALAPCGVMGMACYRLVERGRLYGMVGFDAGAALALSDEEAQSLTRLCRILAMAALRGTPVRQSASTLAIASLLEAMPTITYTVDRETYEILSANRVLRRRWPRVGVGMPCYEAIFGRAAPCARCPMRQLDPARPGDSARMEVMAPEGDGWLRVCASWGPGQGEGGRSACLLNAIDMTGYER